MGTAEFSYLSTASFTCQQTFTKNQRFTVLSTVSFTCQQAFTEIQGITVLLTALFTCRQAYYVLEYPSLFRSYFLGLFWISICFNFLFILVS